MSLLLFFNGGGGVPHARELIRDRIVTLCTGLTTTGANVFRSRVYPVATASLPGLSIFTLEEEFVEDVATADPGETDQWRDLTVAIQAHVRATADYDETLDDICLEVETALGASRFLGVGVWDSHYLGLDVEMDDEAEQPTVLGTIRWQVRYAVNAADPGTIVAA